MQTLLTSARYVKSVTNLSDNVSDKFLSPAIYEAQYFDLQSILGFALYNKICALVKANAITQPQFTHYKSLLDECQIYLAYDVAAKICFRLNYHMDNSGIYTNKDENKDTVSMDDLVAIQGHYQSKADGYAKHLQNYILRNKNNIPEITHEVEYSIKSNLYSAASTNIFLGGRRGKILGGTLYDAETDNLLG